MRVTAPKSPASKTPAVKTGLREDQSNLAAGNHADADHGLVPAEPERGEAGRQLAGDSGDDENAADHKREAARGFERVEGLQVDRRPHGHEEEGHEEVAHLGDAVLDLTDLRHPHDQETGRERADDHFRAALLGKPGHPQCRDQGHDGRCPGQLDPAGTSETAGE